MSENLETLTDEYLKQMIDEITAQISYIWNQPLENSGNVVDNLMKKRKEIKDELSKR